MEQEVRVKRDFTKYAKRLSEKRAPLNKGAYNRWGNINNSVRGEDMDLDRIREIIRSGNAVQIRELSQYFYRINGVYRNSILLLSNLSLYQTVVMPIYDSKKVKNQDSLRRAFLKALAFVDNLEVPINFARITHNILLNGIYYGILREDGASVTIQDLPIEYCRCRYKDCNNLNIIEFNVGFFDTITDDDLRAEAIESYPFEVQRYYHSRPKTQKDFWISISAAQGGICFYLGDQTPLLLPSIVDVYQFAAAVDREAARDNNEMKKIFVQQAPYDGKGNLIFELEELAEIQGAVADALTQDDDTIAVVTTPCKPELFSVQDSTAATQSSSRIEKYKNNTFDNLGLPSLYFNADTSAAMPYANAKNEAIICSLINQYSRWIEAQVNHALGKGTVSFDVSILPTTHINYKDWQAQYFQGAQYGYSKIIAGVALGIKEIDLVPSMEFETDILHMLDKMQPLNSSYTSSGKKNSENEIKNVDDSKAEDIKIEEKETSENNNEKDEDSDE